MAYNVNGLPEYVEVNKEQIINKVALGGKFLERVTKQTGIKSSAYINFLDTNPALQDGSTCGFTASGDTTLSQRTIKTAQIKVNLSWCPKTLLGKYAEYLVRIGADKDGAKLPFEEEIIANVISHINEKIEKAFWFGDTTSTDTDLKWFDGIIKTAKADSDVVDVTIATSSSAYDAIKAVYLAIPEEVLGKAEIYVSPALYRQFLQELVEKNYYHYAPGEDAPTEFVFPGTDTKVVKVQGLATTATNKYIVAADPKELVYGTDLESNAEDADLWFSRDDQLYKMAIDWNSGAQYMFGDRVVLGAYTELNKAEE